MASLVRDGVALAYEQSGADDGIPFVFVHGWCCDRSFFAPQIEHFGRSHPVLAVDLRGHGESAEVDGGFSIEGFAADVAWMCDELGIGRAVVVGHSMGGITTMQLAADRPDLVRAAVMVDPAHIRWPDNARSYLTHVVEKIRTDAAEGNRARTRMVEGMFHPDDDEDRKRHILQAMLSAPPATAAGAMEALRDYDGEAAARTVTVPVLCIPSDGPTFDREYLLGLIPHAVYEQTVGIGHFNQLEAPDAVNEIIERFMA